MQKEMKFRAWDTVRKVMFLVQEATFVGGRIIGVRSCGTYDNACILMQYTGLKDKNGKEIYEGDVMFNSSDRYNYEVIWDGKNGAWSLGFNGNGLGRYQLDLFWEIVGNRYENPELLNEEKK